MFFKVSSTSFCCSEGAVNEISVIDFDYTDVVRHPLVSKIVKAYSDQNSEK